MLADEGIGEWGFAALVEADGQRILFDTGRPPGHRLRNARELRRTCPVLGKWCFSHNHDDHTAAC